MAERPIPDLRQPAAVPVDVMKAALHAYANGDDISYPQYDWIRLTHAIAKVIEILGVN